MIIMVFINAIIGKGLISIMSLFTESKPSLEAHHEAFAANK